MHRGNIAPESRRLSTYRRVQISAATSGIPAEARTIDVNGYPMAYVEKGTGTPFVLVHGAGQDFRYFSSSMDALSSRHRVISVSLRHHFPEPWDGKGGYAIEEHASDLVAFIRALGVGPVHLLGHSYGGTVAYFAAKQAPNLLRSVVSAEGMPVTTLFPEQTEAERAGWAKVASLFESGDVEAALRAFLGIVGGDWDKAPERTRAALRANAWTIHALSKLTRKDAECVSTQKLDVPFLLLQGQATLPEYVEALDKLALCISRVERETIPGATHVFPRTHSSEFATAVLAFVAKH